MRVYEFQQPDNTSEVVSLERVAFVRLRDGSEFVEVGFGGEDRLQLNCNSAAEAQTTYLEMVRAMRGVQ